MIDRERLIARLKKAEGERLSAYDDKDGAPIRRGSKVQGTASIGYGRNLTSSHGISAIEAEFMLRNDVSDLEVKLPAALPGFKGLDDVRQEVLLEMAYQLGVHGLLGFHDAILLISDGRYAEAATAMLASDWHSRVPARAERLAQAMRTGISPATVA